MSDVQIYINTNFLGISILVQMRRLIGMLSACTLLTIQANNHVLHTIPGTDSLRFNLRWLKILVREYNTFFTKFQGIIYNYNDLLFAQLKHCISLLWLLELFRGKGVLCICRKGAFQVNKEYLNVKCLHTSR